MPEFSPAQRRFILEHRVARLATAGAEGAPHIVPITYAFDGERFFSAIDEKPKRVGPAELKRVRNIQENPRAALVIDVYEEDWSRLAYLMVRGPVVLLHDGPEHQEAIQLLRDRYPQYQSMRLEERPVLRLTPERVSAWGAIG